MISVLDMNLPSSWKATDVVLQAGRNVGILKSKKKHIIPLASLFPKANIRPFHRNKTNKKDS